jgi:hypothetical protein
MDISNAFIGRKDQPTDTEVLSVLGKSAPPWKELVAWLAQEQGVTGQEWKSVSPKYGWALRLSVNKRNIVHLSPCADCFRVVLILGDRAVKAALQSDLPKSIADQIRNARRYAEGTGVRLVVKRAGDLPAIRKLALIKLAN